MAAVIIICEVNLGVNGFKAMLRPFMPGTINESAKRGIASRPSVVSLFVRRP